MLKLKTTTGAIHLVCHINMSDLPALREIQRRFNGEIALWSTSHNDWIQLALFDLEKTSETEIGVVVKEMD